MIYFSESDDSDEGYWILIFFFMIILFTHCSVHLAILYFDKWLHDTSYQNEREKDWLYKNKVTDFILNAWIRASNGPSMTLTVARINMPCLGHVHSYCNQLHTRPIWSFDMSYWFPAFWYKDLPIIADQSACAFYSNYFHQSDILKSCF